MTSTLYCWALVRRCALSLGLMQMADRALNFEKVRRRFALPGAQESTETLQPGIWLPARHCLFDA